MGAADKATGLFDATDRDEASKPLPVGERGVLWRGGGVQHYAFFALYTSYGLNETVLAHYYAATALVRSLKAACT